MVVDDPVDPMRFEDDEFDRARFESANHAMLRNAGFLLIEAYRAIQYFLSFLPLVLLLSYFRRAHPAVLLALLIAGSYLAGVTFIFLPVIVKKIFVGRLGPDRTLTVNTRAGRQFFFASILHSMSIGPFRWLLFGLSPLAAYYYRGMGARMADSVFISPGAAIFDPWFLEIQENASIGAEAMILGHIGNGRELVLGSVFIGEGAIIGSRAVVLPSVRIGRHARLAVGAVAVRGTVIPDGETWAGIPARKISTGVTGAAKAGTPTGTRAV